MYVQCTWCVFLLHARRQQWSWMRRAVFLRMSRAADSKVIHELIAVLLYLLFPRCWDVWMKPSCCFCCCCKVLKHSQLHCCVQLRLVPKKHKKLQRSFLPVFWAPLICLQQPFHRWQAEEGREGQLFNPLQCKHDPFEWRGISQDILVWADLPKQPQTTAALCLSFTDKPLRYESSTSAPVCPKAEVKGMFWSVECVVACMRAWHWHDPHPLCLCVSVCVCGSQLAGQLKQLHSCKCVFSRVSWLTHLVHLQKH